MTFWQILSHSNTLELLFKKKSNSETIQCSVYGRKSAFSDPNLKMIFEWNRNLVGVGFKSKFTVPAKIHKQGIALDRKALQNLTNQFLRQSPDLFFQISKRKLDLTPDFGLKFSGVNLFQNTDELTVRRFLHFFM